MAQTVELKTAGLSLTDNELTAQGGSLKVASNLIMDRGNIYRARRGLPAAAYGYASALSVDALVNFGGYRYAAGYSGLNANAPLLVAQASLAASYAAVTASSPFSSASYSFGPLTAASPMRAAEANKNLYLSTWQGVQRIDKAGSNALLAGMARAWDAAPVLQLQNDAQSAGTYNTGFLQADSACAYRVVWGYKDRNGAIVLGPPSGRTTARNPKYKTARIQKNATLGVSVVDINSPNPTYLPDSWPSAIATAFKANDYIDISPANATNTAPTVKAIAASGGATGAVAAGGGTQLYYVTDANNAASPSWSTGYTLSLGMRPVRVSFTVPARFTSPDYPGQFFVRVYRSKLAASADTEPSDEMYLCYETNLFGSPSGSPVTLTFSDLTPDALLGEALYTNPTQEGILQSNYLPPVCEDVALFAGSLFFANTRQPHRFSLQMLAAGGTTGVQVGEAFTIGSETYTAVASTSATSGVTGVSGNYRVFTDASLSQQQQLRLTCQSLVQVVNTYSSIVRAYYISGPQDAAGKVMFEALNPGHVRTATTLTNGFAVAYSATKTCFIPALPTAAASNYTITQRGADGLQTLSLVSGLPHGFSVGDRVQVVTSSSTLNATLGLKTITEVPSATTFKIYEPYQAAGINSEAVVLFKATVYSDDEARPHRLHFSKTGIPEAVPLLNYLDIGSANYPIRRILAVGTSLFIFKDDGVFRVTGYDTTSLQVEAFDPTVRLLAYNSPAKLANFIYAWTNQGVVALNESGVQVLSRPIDAALLPVVPSLVAANGYAAGVGYESERLYLLCLSDKVYVYNLLAEAWTSWGLAGLGSGVVDAGSDRLLLWQANSQYPRLENKARTSVDFFDGTASISLTACSDIVASPYGYYVCNLSTAATVGRGAKLVLSSGAYANTVLYAAQDSAGGVVRALLPKAQYTAGLRASINGGVSATVYAPVPVELQWVAQTGDAPQQGKHWREFALFTRDDSFGLLRSQFDSDLNKTVSDVKQVVSSSLCSTAVSPMDKGTSRVVLIPRVAQRASRLTCNLFHAFAQQEFFLLGMSLTVAGYGSESKVHRG